MKDYTFLSSVTVYYGDQQSSGIEPSQEKVRCSENFPNLKLPEPGTQLLFNVKQSNPLITESVSFNIIKDIFGFDEIVFQGVIANNQRTFTGDSSDEIYVTNLSFPKGVNNVEDSYTVEIWSYNLSNTINYSNNLELLSPTNRVLQSEIAKKLFNFGGFAYDPSKDLFYSLRDAWQSNLGYFALYDLAAPFALMFIHCEPVKFSYDNRDWNIEFWKGQYGIATGAEIGIYTGKFGTNSIGKLLGPISHFIPDDTECAQEKDWLKMSFVLKRKGKEFFTRNSDDPTITPNIKKDWWLTGFKVDDSILTAPSDLINEITIELKDNAMLVAFSEALNKLGYTIDNNNFFHEEGSLEVKIIFAEPFTKQPSNIVYLYDDLVKKVEIYFPKVYNFLESNIPIEKIGDALMSVYNLGSDVFGGLLSQFGYAEEMIEEFLNNNFSDGTTASNFYIAPTTAPKRYAWSQKMSKDPNDTSWGKYWRKGNSVSYAFSYKYSNGYESSLSPWMEWQIIDDFALAQVLVTYFPFTSINKMDSINGWCLYRRFLVNGQITLLEKIGYTDILDKKYATIQEDGTYIIIDQGNTKVR